MTSQKYRAGPVMTKGGDGKYHNNGKTYEFLIGSRAQVMHGTAYKTSGGLVSGDLKKSASSGKIVSKTRSATAKRDNRLGKAGYTYEKGKFGAVKMGTHKRHRGRPRKTPRKKLFGIFK